MFCKFRVSTYVMSSLVLSRPRFSHIRITAWTPRAALLPTVDSRAVKDLRWPVASHPQQGLPALCLVRRPRLWAVTILVLAAQTTLTCSMATPRTLLVLVPVVRPVGLTIVQPRVVVHRLALVPAPAPMPVPAVWQAKTNMLAPRT